jgi:hypothetical protein
MGGLQCALDKVQRVERLRVHSSRDGGREPRLAVQRGEVGDRRRIDGCLAITRGELGRVVRPTWPAAMRRAPAASSAR